MKPTVVSFSGAGGDALVADRRGPWPSPDPVLLLHGGGQTRHAWGQAANRLAEAGHASFALDQRGHGESAWPGSGAYAFEDYAADVVAVACSLAEHGGAPILVGASLGGLASLLAVGEMSAPARALVLVDVTPSIERAGVEKVQGFMAERSREGFAALEEAADAIARYLPHRPRRRSLDGLRKNLRLGADRRWRWHWDPRFLDGPRSINHDSEGAQRRMIAAARALAIPTLLVRGAASELVGEAQTAEFLRLAPHAEFFDVSGARHMVAGDANDAFTEAVLGFVGQLDAGKA